MSYSHHAPYTARLLPRGALTLRVLTLTLLTVTACAIPAQAQQVSLTDPEFTPFGRITTDGPDNVPQTPDDVLGAPQATVFLSGVGYIDGGVLFAPGPIPGFPFSPIFRTGVPNDERGANYTFVFDAGPGVVTDPFSGPGDTSVVTQYTFGTLSFFRAGNADGIQTNNAFGTGTPAARSTFADGIPFLSSSIPSATFSYNPQTGQGTLNGTLTFTGGELFASFLAPNNLLNGTFSLTTSQFDPNIPGGTAGTYDYTLDGRIDVGATVAAAAPEPASLALLVLIGLPLAASVVRRRS